MMKRKPPKNSNTSNLSEREKAINALNICKEEELEKVPLFISRTTKILVSKKLTKSEREAKRQYWQSICK